MSGDGGWNNASLNLTLLPLPSLYYKEEVRIYSHRFSVKKVEGKSFKPKYNQHVSLVPISAERNYSSLEITAVPGPSSILPTTYTNHAQHSLFSRKIWPPPQRGWEEEGLVCTCAIGFCRIDLGRGAVAACQAVVYNTAQIPSITMRW